MRIHTKQSGFSLVELMVALILLIIITAISIPLFMDLIENKKLYAATEKMTQRVKYFHSEAIKRNIDITMAFQTTGTWCYGFDDNSTCNCSNSNSCLYDSVETVFSGSSHPDIAMSLSGFSTTAGIDYFTIDGTRGVVNSVGTVSFTINGKTATVTVNKLGRTSVCSSDISDYPAC